jgi:hypothetical protein
MDTAQLDGNGNGNENSARLEILPYGKPNM